MPMASRSESPPPPLIRMREGEAMDTRPDGSVTKQLKKKKKTQKKRNLNSILLIY